MGIFGTSADVTVQEDVERATNEKTVEEDWSIIISICDRAGKSSEDAKAYLRNIVKRLYNSDPHIGVKAVTLLDACIKNCGKTFQTEVASREFENDFTKLMQKAHPSVAKKLRESLKRWAENEFKTDPQLSLIPSLYSKLRGTYDFSSDPTPVKKTAPVSKDPNVVESQEEEEQILKAIELSLKDAPAVAKTPATNTTSSSLYPSTNLSSVTATPAMPQTKEPRKVRALYDFEAAEDNELTFEAGEIIMVTDDSDPNWWKGTNQRGEGLFPANFVTADLSAEPEKLVAEKAKKNVQFNEEVKVKVEEKEPEEVEIDEQKIDQVLHLLHEADPTNPETDTQVMLSLEREAIAMGPLIDAELERVDRKHAQLTQLSADLVEALGLYHTLMREPQFPTIGKGGYGYAQSGGPPLSQYNSLPHQMPSHQQHQMGPMGPPPHPMAHTMIGPPGLPHGVQERLPYQPPIHHFQPPPGIPPSGMPSSVSGLPSLPVGSQNMSQGGQMPQGQPQQQGPPGQQPPHVQGSQRNDGQMMGQGIYQSMPTFIAAPPGMSQQHHSIYNQAILPNGPPAQPHFNPILSSTHMSH